MKNVNQTFISLADAIGRLTFERRVYVWVDGKPCEVRWINDKNMTCSYKFGKKNEQTGMIEIKTGVEFSC